MKFDLQKILDDKRRWRRDIAARPIEEKLRMLDALRERELAIRSHTTHSDSGVLREEPAPYRTLITGVHRRKPRRRPRSRNHN